MGSFTNIILSKFKNGLKGKKIDPPKHTTIKEKIRKYIHKFYKSSKPKHKINNVIIFVGSRKENNPSCSC